MTLGLHLFVAACLAALATQAPTQPAATQQKARRVSWPPSSERVVFAFGTAFETLLAHEGPGTEPIFNYTLERHGLTRIDGAGALLLSHGTASAPRQDTALPQLLSDAPGFSVQAWVTPPASPPGEERTLFAHGVSRANFELTQSARTITFRMRIGKRIVQVAGESPSSGSQHVCVTYDAERLALFVNGKEIAATEGLAGGFEAWVPGPLVFGCGTPARAGWSGALEGFAIHAVALTPEEVLDCAKVYALGHVQARTAAHVTRLVGKLVAQSRVPTPETVAPYPEALAVFEYEVVRVLEGFYLAKKMRVAHWVVLGETALARGRLTLGDEVDLTVVDFAKNPQLETVNISDTLEFDFDLLLHFDVEAPLAAGGK